MFKDKVYFADPIKLTTTLCQSMSRHKYTIALHFYWSTKTLFKQPYYTLWSIYVELIMQVLLVCHSLQKKDSCAPELRTDTSTVD